MDHDSRNKLLAAVDAFVEGADRSKRAAGELEVLIDDVFGDIEPFATAVHMLASYQPGGGEFMYNETQVVEQLKYVKRALSK